MPHEHLLKLRHLIAAAVCLLFVSQAVSGDHVAAQPRLTGPAQAPRTWSEPVSLSNTDEPFDSENPDIAVCADGTVYAVWEEDRGERDHQIWYRVYRPSEGWNEATPILPGPNALGRDPAIAVDPDCVAHLAWSRYWQGSYEIFYTFNEGNGFEIAQDVSSTSGDDSGSFQPDITVNSSGEPHIVWVEMVPGGGPQLYEGWPPPPGYPMWPKRWIAGTDGQQVQVPALVSDRNDQYHLAWMRQDGSRLDIMYKRPEDWLTTVVENLSDSSSPSRLPDIAIGGNKVVVVWQEAVDRGNRTSDDETYETWRWLDSFASFVSPSNLSNSDANSRSPAITADGLGKFFVAWGEGSPTEAILTRPWPGAGNWWNTQAISNGGIKVRDPAIAASPQDSHVYAVWAQKDGARDTWDIYFSKMETPVYRFYLTLIANRYRP